MILRILTRRWEIGLFLLVAVLLSALIPEADTAPDKKAKALAKKLKMKSEIAVAKPPELIYVFPAGGQRGTTVEVAIHGVGILKTDQVRISGDGVTVKILEAEEAGETRKSKKTGSKQPVRQKNPLELDTQMVRASITIAPNATLGERDLRVFTPTGVSNRFRFIVGQLPEINESEPNNRLEEAQILSTLPLTVNGQLTAGDVDVYRFQAKAGQTIVCDFQGRRLLPFVADAVPGWLQGVLTLFDPEGRELNCVDDFRLNPDPLLAFQPEKDGEYRLEVRDALYRGTPKFVYRLNIGAIPYITDVFPMGGRRGSQVQVKVNGFNLGTDKLTVNVPKEGFSTRVGMNGGSLATNTVPFAIDDLEEAFEKEGNDSLEKANPVQVGQVINGCIQKAGDVDYFEFSAQAKDALVIDVCARRLGSPLDSYIAVFDAKGKLLVANDDTPDPWESAVTYQSDSRIVATVPITGKYYICLKDIQGNGGPEYSYRLAIAPPQPDFRLRIVPDNPCVGSGDTAVLKAEVVRRDGFNGEIKLSLTGLPKGFRSTTGVILPNQNECLLGLTPPPETKPEMVPLNITGTAEINGKTVTHQAIPAEEVMQAFYYLHRVPTKEFLLGVTGSAPLFTLSTGLKPGEVIEVMHPGKKFAQTPTGEFKIKVKRTEGGTGFIKFSGALSSKNKPATVGMFTLLGTAARDETEAVVKITPTPRVVVGEVYETIVTGTMKFNKEELVRSTIVPIKIIANPKAEAESKTNPQTTPKKKNKQK